MFKSLFSSLLVGILLLPMGNFSHAEDKPQLTFEPENPDGYVGEITCVKVRHNGNPVDLTNLEASVKKPADSKAEEIVPEKEPGGSLCLQAPESLPDDKSVTYTISVNGKIDKEVVEGETELRIDKRSTLEWESRAIVGWQQAGASSTESEQNVFFDFYVSRPFGGGAVYDSRFKLWGQVRVASSPQQITIPLSQFAVDFAEQLGSVPVNELAMSAEFLTGFEVQAHAWRGSGRIRTIGIVAFFGANGAFSDPTTRGRVFRVPPSDSPQFANFAAQFPGFNDPEFRSKAPFIGMVPPDRERFYRQYGGGIRYCSYHRDKPWASPTMFTATVGQDQSVTGGRYRGPTFKFDAFYPLPLSFGGNEARFIYLFGTANLAVTKPRQPTPLALQLVSNDCAEDAPAGSAGVECGVELHQDDVAIFAIPSSRDTYRIGVGIDMISLLKRLGAF